ncbi:NADPH-dependent F420 reductase [soil metagenome]
MTTLSIIGNGSMATAIAGLAAKSGTNVEFVGREATTIVGDIVVLAVPYPEAANVIATHGAALAGKVVVDITNPLDFSTFDSLVVPADSSAAAVIAAALPESRVLKAFNTTLAATVNSGKVGDADTTVLIAGDDVEGKNALAALITAGGLAAIDAGSLARARELEAIGFLQLTLAVGEKIGWTGGFSVAA